MLSHLAPFQVFQERITGSVGATAVDYYVDGPPPGEVWEIDRVCLYNSHATQTISAALGPCDGKQFNRMWGQKTLAALDYNDENLDMYITNPYRIRLRVFGSGDSTTFELVFHGRKYRELTKIMVPLK